LARENRSAQTKPRFTGNFYATNPTSTLTNEPVGIAVMFQTRIRELITSNFGVDIGYIT
jgi:hypothetical protein